MLRCEPLEPRCLPATLFVITHGLQLDTDQVPAWTQDLAAAISRRLGLGVSPDALRASVQAYDAPADAPGPGASDRFLIYDWAAASGLAAPGTADDPAVAGRLADLVRARAAAAAARGERPDVHFIGHSRGAIVTLAAVAALDTPADDAALGGVQVTLLDPQDYSTAGRSEAVPLAVPPNADFAANYYQKVDPFPFGAVPGVRDDDGVMGGGVVAGALNVDLSAAVRAWAGRAGGFASHYEARDWFHWTVDADDADAVRYLDPELNREQDQFVARPDAQGRRLVFGQAVDRDADGRPDDLGLGGRTGFFYTLPADGGAGAGGGGPALAAAGGRPDGAVAVIGPVGGSVGVTATRITPLAGVPVRVSTADVTGDGVADLVGGAGPGGGPRVVVLDGASGAARADFFAFEPTFTGGVFVAAADLNGDGRAEVVVTPDRGGGPVVAVYDGAKLAAGLTGEAAQLARFLGIEDPAFRGGARPAVGDVNADGAADLIVAAGFGGGPRVAVFDGARVLDPSTHEGRVVIDPRLPQGGPTFGIAGTYAIPRKLVGDFFVFEQTLRNGVFVAAGDLTGDGAAEVVVGGGPGGGPRVLALDGRALAGGAPTPVANFFAGDSALRGGVRVAVVPDATGRPQLVTGSGDGVAARVRVYQPASARAGGPPDQELTPFGGAVLADGVFVG